MYFSSRTDSGKDTLYYPKASLLKAGSDVNQTEKMLEAYQVDFTNFPSNMTLIGQLDDPDELTNEHVLLAYSGDELRGVSPLVDGKFFINLFGNLNEKLSFSILDADAQEFNTLEEVSFEADQNFGELSKPFQFHITGVKTSDAEKAGGVKIYPTVYHDVINFNMNLSEDTRVTIELFDILGKKLTTITDQEMNTGKQSYHWIHAYDGENLPVGLQVVKISYDGKVVATQKLIHTK